MVLPYQNFLLIEWLVNGALSLGSLIDDEKPLCCSFRGVKQNLVRLQKYCVALSRCLTEPRPLTQKHCVAPFKVLKQNIVCQAPAHNHLPRFLRQVAWVTKPHSLSCSSQSSAQIPPSSCLGNKPRPLSCSSQSSAQILPSRILEYSAWMLGNRLSRAGFGGHQSACLHLCCNYAPDR